MNLRALLAAAIGATILLHSPGVYARLDYDPVKDFAPVSLMAVSPYLLVVNPSVPAKRSTRRAPSR